MANIATEGTPLEKLYQMLVYLNFPTEHIPPGVETPFEALLVAIDQPEPGEGHKWITQMFFIEDILKNAPSSDIQQDPNDETVTLQFMLEIPLSLTGLSQERLLEAFNLLHRCSSIIPIGHFGINPEQGIYFNYALRRENKNIDLPLIIDILEMISFFMPRLLEPVSALIETDQSYDALLENLERNITAPPQEAD